MPNGDQLGGFDRPQVPGGRQIRPQPAQNDPAAEQGQGGFRVEAAELERAAIEPGETADGLAEDADHRQGDQPGGDAAAQPIPDAVVQERPAHEGIAAADQLGHFDLGAAVLDVEPDGIADDDHDSQCQQG